MGFEMITIQQLYGDFWQVARPGFHERVGASLGPRGSGLLMEVFAWTGVGPEHGVLDIGSRDAGSAIRIAEKFGCRVTALDPVEAHVEGSRLRIAEAGMQDRVTAALGRIEALPCEDGTIDRI